MLNKFIGIGRWAKENDMRYSSEGTAIVNNTLAMNDRFNKDNTTFLPVVMFKKLAENTANFTSKGSLVAIEGRIQVRSWEKDGQKRYVTEVVADSVQFLDTKNNQGNTNTPNQQNNVPHGNQTPYSNGSDPFAREDGGPIDIQDSDLPF